MSSSTKTITASAGPAILKMGAGGHHHEPHGQRRSWPSPAAPLVVDALDHLPGGRPRHEHHHGRRCCAQSQRRHDRRLGSPGQRQQHGISATVVGAGRPDDSRPTATSATAAAAVAGYFGFTGAPTPTPAATTILSGLVNPGANDIPFGAASNPIILSGGGLLATANATYAATRKSACPRDIGYLRQYSDITMTVNGLISGAGHLEQDRFRHARPHRIE